MRGQSSPFKAIRHRNVDPKTALINLLVPKALQILRHLARKR